MRPLIDVTENPFDVDQFHVGQKDKDYAYIWANKKPDNLEKMKAIWGWEVVGTKASETALVPPNAAGERVNGDVILMRMPIERYNKIQKLKADRAANMAGAANDRFKEEAERGGLLVDDTTKRTQSSVI